MKKAQIFNNHFQNFKTYAIPKAQLIIADIPYNLGFNPFLWKAKTSTLYIRNIVLCYQLNPVYQSLTILQLHQ